jgi:AAA+ ATPase superfamily predicted ATPase
MLFIDRENELALLWETEARSEKRSQITVMVGRRRTGKTSLVLQAFREKKFLYFFVARKAESLLCDEFTEEIRGKFGLPVTGEFKTFARLFEFLLDRSQNEQFTLVVDEFQEFGHINPSVYGEMQDIWDRYKSKGKMNLVLTGSVYSMMKKIFENSKEPLFGRADERLYLRPFSVDVIRRTVQEACPNIKPEDLLAFYALTGGVARYVEIFIDRERYTLNQMLAEIFRENSLLLDEGRNLLIEEFGRDYTTYFSILSLIASSKTSRGEIESILNKDIGGYLERLEKEYQIIKIVRPILAKPGGKLQKYMIEDNFLAFWFRFIYKYRSAIEIGNFDYVRSVVERDFSVFSGPCLEKYFREKLAMTKEYSEIGRYWEKGNMNEIDIVAINEKDRKILFAEVKRNKTKTDKQSLRVKTENLLRNFSGYSTEFKLFSLEDLI